MAKRDPNKTARNKRIAAIKDERRKLQPLVFAELRSFEGGRYCTEDALNAMIGSKADDYLNLAEDVIRTPMDYTSRWISGLKKALDDSKFTGTDPRHERFWRLIQGKYPNFKKYLSLFLEGSFLKHYEEHYKVKPKISESECWFGNNDDEFGLLITPRFANGQWENDKSEIRHFSQPYWTIGHVMTTGLCYMSENKTRTFSKVSDYLQFFRDLVRRTKSVYQLQIADLYINYVLSSLNPLDIPLLIPELRYDPFKTRHQHRLDYLIINPYSMEKYGFEFSPWSSHGKLEGAKKSLSQLNDDARANWEKEMQKHKKYWRRYGVSYIIYTDQDLADISAIWNEMVEFLGSNSAPQQLELALILDLCGASV